MIGIETKPSASDRLIEKSFDIPVSSNYLQSVIICLKVTGVLQIKHIGCLFLAIKYP